MKKLTGCVPSLAFLVAPAIIFSFSAPALAQDDGARAYWKGRAGTHAVSFQYLPMFMDAEGSKAFAPGQYIYPNSNIDGHVLMATYGYHFTLPWVKRPSVIAVNVIGGSIGADVDATVPSGFRPPDISAGAFSSAQRMSSRGSPGR